MLFAFDVVRCNTVIKPKTNMQVFYICGLFVIYSIYFLKLKYLQCLLPFHKFMLMMDIQMLSVKNKVVLCKLLKKRQYNKQITGRISP